MRKRYALNSKISVVNQYPYKNLRPEKRRKLPKKASIFAVSLLVIAGVILLAPWKLITASKIEMEPSVTSCISREDLEKDKNIIQSSEILYGKKDVTQEFSSYPCVKSAWVNRIDLSTLKFELNARQPAVIIKPVDLDSQLGKLLGTETSPSAQLTDSPVSSSSAEFLADDQGVVFAPFLGGDFPEIDIVTDKILIGSKIEDENIPKILNILNKLNELSIKYSRIALDNNSLVIYDSGAHSSQTLESLILLLSQDTTRQITTFQVLSDKETRESKKLRTVDLRFDRPVVTFWK